MLSPGKKSNSALVQAIATAAKPSARSPLAVLLILWLVAAAFFAVNPSLHHWLHDDAGEETHECALTVFQKEQLLPAEPASDLICLTIGLAQKSCLCNDGELFTAVYNVSFGRAPPV